MSNENQKYNNIYRTLKNNNATNQLSRLDTSKRSQQTTSASKETGKISLSRSPKKTKTSKNKYQVDDVTAWISKQVGPAQMQLFDYLNYQFSKDNHSEDDQTVFFTVEEYAKDSDLKIVDKNGNFSRYPANKLQKNLRILMDLDFEYSNSKYSTGVMHPISSFKIKRRNRDGQRWVSVNFDKDFVRYLKEQAYAIPMHKVLFQINAQTNAVEYDLLRALLVNKRMNFGTPRADRMNVGTLMSKTSLPTYDEVMQYNKGRVSELIIQPFFTSLEPLSEVFDYYFDDGQGNLISYNDDNHGEGISFDSLVAKDIVVAWKDYPSAEVKRWIESRKHFKANTKRRRAAKKR